MAARQGFNRERIEARSRNPPLSERGHQRAVVNQFSTRNIDQQCMRSHGAQLCFADERARFIRRRGSEDDEIAFTYECVNFLRGEPAVRNSSLRIADTCLIITTARWI